MKNYQMNIMNKLNDYKMKPTITREILMQYVFDYGINKASQLLRITPEKANDLINNPPHETVYYERKMLKKRNVKNVDIEKFISKNYYYLFNEFVKDELTLNISKTNEDIFHDCLTALLEDHSDYEGELMNYIKTKINAYMQRHKADTKSYKKIMDNVDNYDFDICQL